MIGTSSSLLNFIERHTVHASLSKAVIVTVGAAILTMQGLLVARHIAVAEQEIASDASKRADAALNMLASVHTQAMANRKTTADGDGAIATLNGTMAQFSETSRDVSLWVVMGPKIVAFQKRNHSTEMETAKDDVDRLTLDSGAPQSFFSGDMLRRSRPVILGQGAASTESCASCHQGLMGIKPGEVMGAYSASVNMAPERAIFWANTKSEVFWGLFGSLAMISLIVLMLRAAAFRPLANLTRSTQLLANDDLEAEIGYGDRPDEIGKIARALESFRQQLFHKRALAAENNFNSYLAQHDGLTGLANRLQSGAKLDEAILMAQSSKRKVLGVVVDIDRFKNVNDRHGHEAGDAVLRSCGQFRRGCWQN